MTAETQSGLETAAIQIDIRYYEQRRRFVDSKKHSRLVTKKQQTINTATMLHICVTFVRVK